MFGRSWHTLWSRFIEWIWKLRLPLGENWETTTDYDHANLGMLGRLPQELRDIIYEDVISTGHTSILRTSKALFKNMKPVIGIHGLYRVRIAHCGWYGNDEYFLPQQFPNRRRRQNLKIRIEETEPGFQVERSGIKSRNLATILHAVVDPIEKPTYCCLKLEQPFHYPVRPEAFQSLELLRVFKTVDVQAGLSNPFLFT